MTKRELVTTAWQLLRAPGPQPTIESMSEADVWNFYTSLGESDREQLNDVQREVAAICDLRQEVNSGGFDSYFRYWGGNTAPVALSALARILGAQWVELLREAMLLFGPEYPTDVDDRKQELGTGLHDSSLHALDDRFYALEESIDADGPLAAHLAGS